MTYKMKGFSGFGNSPLHQEVKKKGPIMPKDHPVTPPTEEQSKKSKGKPLGWLGEEAWRNRAATFSEMDIEQRRKVYKENKQRIKKFFGW